MLQLYELLFNNLAKATVSFNENGQRREIGLPADALQAVGFEAADGLVDYSPRSFAGYRLLHDYFTFPDKFMFFDIGGLKRSLAGRDLRTIEINFYFAHFELGERLVRLAQNIGRNNFKLGCTPIINLFKQQAEPIKLTHALPEYPVTPDVRLQGNAEVVSIDRVRRVRKLAGNDTVSECNAFFEPRGELGPDACYWIGRRQPSRRGSRSGTDMMIRVVDRELDLIDTSSDTLSIAMTCSNRDLPQLLSYGGSQSDFSLEHDGVVDSIRMLRKPTATARVPLGDGLIWRLVSHLSLNHLSLVANGKEVLQEMLSLYNYRRGLAVRKQISGILSINSEPMVARIGHPRPNFVRGVGITLELDESQYIGSGVFLFGKILDHFFSQYCTVNSFTQLTLRTRQREKRIVQWPPRTGDQPLV